MVSEIFSITNETKELFLEKGIEVIYRGGTGPGFYDKIVKRNVVTIRPTCFEVNMNPYKYIRQILQGREQYLRSRLEEEV